MSNMSDMQIVCAKTRSRKRSAEVAGLPYYLKNNADIGGWTDVASLLKKI